MQLITIVEDETEHLRIGDLAASLHADMDCHWVKDLQSFDQMIDELTFELVCYWITDPQESDQSTWFKLAEKQPEVRVILLAKHPCPESYLMAGNIGAVDVVTLNNLPQLCLALHREIRILDGDLTSAPMNVGLAAISTDRQLQATQVLDPVVAESIQKQIKPVETSQPAPIRETVEKLQPSHGNKITGEKNHLDEALPPLVNDVNRALQEDNFELVYQPIMSVHDHSVDNYEVFIRLHRGKELLLPEDFFPEAEKYGLMTAIDCWVVNHAIRKLNEEEDQRLEVAKQTRILPRRVRFFINVSGYSLVDKGVLSKLVKTMITAKAGPERIVVDVDKHTVLTRLENAKVLNRNIKKLKLEFALNHYTEQDNSLDYLKHISIDYLKLQASLIENLEKDSHKQRAVKAIVERARQNGIKTMACTVESVATMSYLYQVGIDYMQGYAIADPGCTLEQEVFKDMV